MDDIRELFRNAHEKGMLKHDNYKLIQMVEEPSFFAEDPRAQAIIEKMEGVAYEAHQFNRHWPLETGWSKPEKVVRGAKWTLDQGKEYIFYYGPIIWKSKQYYEFIETGLALQVLESRVAETSPADALLPEYLSARTWPRAPDRPGVGPPLCPGFHEVAYSGNQDGSARAKGQERTEPCKLTRLWRIYLRAVQTLSPVPSNDP